VEFKRDNILLNRLIILDGIGRSGKSLLADIIGSFHAVEKQEYNPFLEYVALAHKYNKISSDIAIAILKTEMDSALYKSMIGRQVNTRLSDLSSLYHYHSPSKYLKRAAEQDGPIIYENVLKENPIYLTWCHDVINKSDIVFDAYGDRLDFIYSNRKPIEIIYDWVGINISERMSKDPTEMQYCIKYKDTTVPEVALGWEEEYLSVTPTERTIKMIYTFLKLNRDTLIKKRNYKNLHVFTFEDLVTNHEKEIGRLKTIIGNDPLPILDGILAKGRCPRKLDSNDFLEKEKKISQKISSCYVQLIAEMNDMYNSIRRIA